MRHLFPALVVCLLSGLSLAQPVTTLSGPGETPDDADESVAPTPCCGAAIVPGGNFEVEANYSGDGAGLGFTHTSNMTLKYSLTDRIQLQLATANLFVAGGSLSPRGFDGVSPGVKFVFLDQGTFVPQLAVSAHAVFPTETDEGAMQTSIDAYAMAYASKDIGPFHFDATASLTLARLTEVIVPQGGASFVATLNFADRWSLASGPYSAFGNEDKLAVDGGWFTALGFSPVPELALSAGAEVGFFPQTRAYSVFAGIAWVPTASAKALFAKKPATASGSPMVAAR